MELRFNNLVVLAYVVPLFDGDLNNGGVGKEHSPLKPPCFPAARTDVAFFYPNG